MLTELWTGLGWGQVLPAVLLLLVFYWWWTRPLINLPPCPTPPLPLLGHLLFLEKNPRKQFMAWRQKLGDLFTIYMGPKPVVVLNGYQVLHEALVKRGDVFSDRAPFYLDQVAGTIGRGLSSGNGAEWKRNRAISMTILRRFGLGKTMCEEKIQEEITYFLEVLSDLKGRSSDIYRNIAMAVLNVLCSVAIGYRYEYSGKTLKTLIDLVHAFMKHAEATTLLAMFPWLRFLPGDLFYAKFCMKAWLDLKEMFAKKNIQESKKRFSDEEADNFITAYLQEVQQRGEDEQEEANEHFVLRKILLDLLFGGTDTSSQTISWCVLYILHQPEVQENIFQEIQKEVGLNRRPSMQDKPKLNYLNAVIMETQRLASLLPLSVPHATSDDVSFMGYTIPKGTNIFVNLDSIHHDPAVWGDDALSFRPDRFLDADNQLSVPDEIAFFGLGRHICLGKDLAKMELFLFLSAMFQRFQFLPEDPQNLPTLKEIFGVSASPHPYRVRCMDRLEHD